MSSPESHSSTPHVRDSLIDSFLEPFSSEHPYVMRDKVYGYGVHYVVDYYDGLPETTKSKEIKTAVHFSMPEEHVAAALAYREAYPVTVEAQIVRNKFQEGSDVVSEEDARVAEKILFQYRTSR